MKLAAIVVGLALLPLLALLESCKPSSTSITMENTYINDPHSYAKPSVSRVEALDLELSVDFNAKVLSGTAHWTLAPGHGDTLILDTYDLEIGAISIDGKGVPFFLGPKDPILGQPLYIPLPANSKKVSIQYGTHPGARALQWLSPEQTAGKQHPFLFTQSQAILARTWLPCQDSPGLRYRYKASIQAPPGMMALMSASNPQVRSADGKYQFEMEIPVPAYLMALAVGDIDFKSVGKRTGVYAEPSMLNKSVDEFAEMEKMLEAAEGLYGPYAWGRYDVLVLPPSFPFGGMENPRLTFATPTIITGDRSLVSLIAHELAHSWSGNLVTNATWNDFWLNEGFTVYFENRIMEAVYGREYSEMLAGISHADVMEEISDLEAQGKSDKTKLKAKMEGEDPDDGVGPIAYDKGYYFLRLIEETIGRERWDTFLTAYFNENAFKSMHTERFIDILKKELTDQEWKSIQPEIWIYENGMPANCPKPESTRFDLVGSALKALRAGQKPNKESYAAWSTHEWVFFIRSLAATDGKLTAQLDEAFGFTQSKNAEILSVWFVYVIKNAPEYAKGKVFQEALHHFLTQVGRRKFLMPTYRALKESGQFELARSIYEDARPNYHAVARQSVDALLGI